jgi:hypothetical protein
MRMRPFHSACAQNQFQADQGYDLPALHGLSREKSMCTGGAWGLKQHAVGQFASESG